MVNLGDRALGSTVSFLFNTHKADGTPITLAGSPVVSVYKNSTTQSTSGVTLSVDYDSVTGMHQVIVDTSADSTFYATNNDFNVVITTGTVNSISVVGSVVGKFSIGRQNISHAASVAWGSGAITAGAIATDAIGADEIAAGAVTKIQTGLATPTNITAGTITTVTNLTNAPTNGDLTAAMKASVNAEVDTALADIDLDHLSKTGSAPTPTIGSNLDKVMNKNASQTFDHSTDSLEAIADNAISGTIDANVVSINGDLTNGNNATLKLKRLDIVNDDMEYALHVRNDVGGAGQFYGKEIGLSIAGGDNHGLEIVTANIDANAITVFAAGTAVKIQSITSGRAIDIRAESGSAIKINSSDGDGVEIVGTDNGLTLTGSGGLDLNLATPSTNIGTPIDTTLSASHGAGAWDGTSAIVDANLISIDGELTIGNNAVLHLKGLDIQNDDPNPAVNIENTVGNAIYVNASIGNAVYINAQGDGVDSGNGIRIISADDSAVRIESNGARAALSIYGEGPGVTIRGGAISGHGMIIETLDSLSDGIKIVGKESGVRILSDGNDAALYLKNTVGDGMAVIGALKGLSLAGAGAEDLHLVYSSSNIGTPIDTTLSASHGVGQWDATSTSTNLTAINGDTTAASNLGKSAKTMVTGKVDDSAFTSTTTIFETDLGDDVYKDRWVAFTSGANKDCAKPIHACATVGAKVRLTTYAFPIAPSNNDEFIII